MNGTQLHNRILWYDGSSSWDVDTATTRILNGLPVDYVTQLNSDLIEYNRSSSIKVKVKHCCDQIPTGKINIPESYATLNVTRYVIDLHYRNMQNHPDFQSRERRLIDELKLFKQHKLFDLIRILIYVVDQLVSHDEVWGVGRGSSTSSYLLYVIGIHAVDSFLYDLDISDFIH